MPKRIRTLAPRPRADLVGVQSEFRLVRRLVAQASAAIVGNETFPSTGHSSRATSRRRIGSRPSTRPHMLPRERGRDARRSLYDRDGFVGTLAFCSRAGRGRSTSPSSRAGKALRHACRGSRRHRGRLRGAAGARESRPPDRRGKRALGASFGLARQRRLAALVVPALADLRAWEDGAMPSVSPSLLTRIRPRSSRRSG